MKRGILRFNLKEHCIETALKKRFKEVVAEYANSEGVDADVEGEIQVLKKILEEWDFRRLRAEYPLLSGGTDIEVEVVVEESGRFILKVNGMEVNLE